MKNVRLLKEQGGFWSILRRQVSRRMPAVIFAVIVGTLIGILLDLDEKSGAEPERH